MAEYEGIFLSIVRIGYTKPVTASLRVGFSVRTMLVVEERVAPELSVTRLTWLS